LSVKLVEPQFEGQTKTKLGNTEMKAFVQKVVNDQLGDSTNRAWVVWEDTVPVAMTLVATDIRRTRWLSEQYFRRHYPDHVASGRVHYVVWAVVDPAFTTRGASMFLARQAMAAEARDGALLVFDMPEENQPNPGGGGAELMYRMARMVGGAELVPLAVQRYYALDFAKPTESGKPDHHDDHGVLSR
jgi:hypothetical protein